MFCHDLAIVSFLRFVTIFDLAIVDCFYFSGADVSQLAVRGSPTQEIRPDDGISSNFTPPRRFDPDAAIVTYINPKLASTSQQRYFCI